MCYRMTTCPPFNLDPRINSWLPFIHTAGKAVTFHLVVYILPACLSACVQSSDSLQPHTAARRAPLSTGFPSSRILTLARLKYKLPWSVLKLKWGNFFHRGWQSPRMPSDSGDEFSDENPIGCLFLLPAQGKSYWPGQKAHSVSPIFQKTPNKLFGQPNMILRWFATWSFLTLTWTSDGLYYLLIHC